MIKHIVFWRLKEHANGMSKPEIARAMREKLEALRGSVPGLLQLEVGLDINRSETSSDLALYSEFQSREALQAYQDHADHQAFAAFSKELRIERRVVDYEV